MYIVKFKITVNLCDGKAEFSASLRPVHTGTNFARDIRRRLTPSD